MTVSGHSKPLAARVTPNPLNPSGVLAFRTSGDGYVRVRMFDLNGRLVRTLADIPLAVAGDQEVRIDGRGARGETLATGAYFYVIETPEGKTRGRIMILK
jgi:flagellar hook assembly protein FlgD